MTKASDNAYPSILITEGTEPSAPAAGKQRLYIDSTTHALKMTNSSGTDVTVGPSAGGSVATDPIFDAKGDLPAGTGADTAAKVTVGADYRILQAEAAQSTGLSYRQQLRGLPVYAQMPPGYTTIAITTGAFGTAGRLIPIVIPGVAYIRGVSFDVSAGGTGTCIWGIYAYDASQTSATELATGSGALNSGAAWTQIAATGAPVGPVMPGAYALIIQGPAANQPTIRLSNATTAPPWNLADAAYSWDTTPDLTASAWNPSTTQPVIAVELDLASGGVRWWQ